MSFELPIFPLNVVLFPGMALPLHIFEPRYRLMINRCLQGDRTFGVALLVDGTEGTSGTRPAMAGCTALILEVSPFDDGRMNLSTVGQRRFTITSLREEDDYLIGTCEWLEDDPNEKGTDESAVRALRRLAFYFESLSQNAELSAELSELNIPSEPQALSLFIAAILSLPNNQKQQLLEMTSANSRLEIEEYLLERAEIVQRAYTRRMASGEEPRPPEDLGQLSHFVSLN